MSIQVELDGDVKRLVDFIHNESNIAWDKRVFVAKSLVHAAELLWGDLLHKDKPAAVVHTPLAASNTTGTGIVHA